MENKTLNQSENHSRKKSPLHFATSSNFCYCEKAPFFVVQECFKSGISLQKGKHRPDNRAARKDISAEISSTFQFVSMRCGKKRAATFFKRPQHHRDKCSPWLLFVFASFGIHFWNIFTEVFFDIPGILWKKTRKIRVSEKWADVWTYLGQFFPPFLLFVPGAPVTFPPKKPNNLLTREIKRRWGGKKEKLLHSIRVWT